MGEHLGWIELVFTAVVALGFGVWQLWSVNREIAADRAKRSEQSADAGHPVGEHELHER
jgi:hypothetical protein